MGRFARWVTVVAMVVGAYLLTVAGVAFVVGNEIWRYPMMFGALLAFSGLTWRLAYLFHATPAQEYHDHR